jgi:catechol 2,3-dioxygenase-like lactoylglutathione lyase family enzyme
VIDHLTVAVTDLASSKEFYGKVFAALGYTLKRDYGVIAGYGDERKPYYWLKQAETGTTPQHIAFVAKSRADVDAFHKAALEAGAKDDGAPGLREHYHPHYYGCFVIDPINGHPIEAVCHLAPGVPAAKKTAPSKKPVAKKAAAPKKAAKKKR